MSLSVNKLPDQGTAVKRSVASKLHQGTATGQIKIP
jgi:hypothetical protein